MYVFVNCAIVALILWGLFAMGTKGTPKMTTKKPGDQLSERGVHLVQAMFWIVIVIGAIGVIASSR